MIGRTMSYLFLTVVAAAIFLVSGCVPPIDAPDSGEQVRAVEAERIRKLEQDVAKAVAAVRPELMQQQKKEVIAEAVAAVRPELMKELSTVHLKEECLDPEKCVTKLQRPLQDAIQNAIQREPDLQEALRDILCVRPGTITLRDVGWFQEAINGDLMDKLLEKDWTIPSRVSWNDTHWIDLSKDEQDRSKVNWKRYTDPKKREAYKLYYGDWSRVNWNSIPPSTKKRTVYTLHYHDLTKAKYAAIRGRIDEWAKKSSDVDGGGREQVVLGRQDTFEPCRTDTKKVQVDYVAVPGVAGAATNQKFLVSITLNVKDVLAISSVLLVPEKGHWLHPYEQLNWEVYPDEKSKRVFQGKGHTINKDRDVFSLRIKGQLKEDPRETIQNNKKRTVYVLIARKHIVNDYPRPFQVVQYREVEIGRPQGTFDDKQIPLERPTLQPACPPTAITDSDVKRKFKDFLVSLGWEEKDKATNLVKWSGCKAKE